MNQSIFNTVPESDYFNFFNSGKPASEKIAKFLDYKKEDISAATDIPLASIRYDSKIPSELKERLIEWATAFNLVGSFFKDENKTILWFKIPNPQLGDISPRDMIRIGRFNKLLKFIQTALNENIPVDDKKKTKR